MLKSVIHRAAFLLRPKLVKTKERKSNAIDLLKGINSAKRKLDFDVEQEGEQNERWKRATRSVTVSFFLFSVCLQVFCFSLVTRHRLSR